MIEEVRESKKQPKIKYLIFDKETPMFGRPCKGPDILKDKDARKGAYVEAWVDGDLETRWELVNEEITVTWGTDKTTQFHPNPTDMPRRFHSPRSVPTD